MADAKITELTNTAVPVSTDIIPYVSDPAGTPLTKKSTVSNLGVIIVSNKKATGAEINTGTDDTKIVTPKAIADSYLSNGYNSLSRQAIINGNFDVWQRGISLDNTGVITSFLLADRWKQANGADGGTLPAHIVISKQSLTPGDIYNSSYFFRVAPDGAGTSLGNNSIFYFEQRVENGTRYLCGNGKKVTISFYARASVAGKKMGYALQQNYGSGGSPTSAETITGASITLSSTWTKYNYTFTTNTLAGKTFGTANDDFLRLMFFYQWGSTQGTSFGLGAAETYGGSGTIDIAQVQLCAGDVALPFMPKSFEEELRTCRRYTFAYFCASELDPIGAGLCDTTTRAFFVVPHKGMRISPTLTATASDWVIKQAGGSIDVTAIAIGYGQPDASAIYADVGSGLTAGHGAFLGADATGNRLLLLESEL